MSIGAFIERRSRESGLDPEALIGRLRDKAIPATTGEMSADNLTSFIAIERLLGLVLVTRDVQRGWQLGQEAMRKAGGDASALKVVHWGDLRVSGAGPDGVERAALLTAAAAAMVREYPWLRPASIRVKVGRLSGRLSRRALLTATRPRYEVIPSVNESRCAASRGCDLCSRACPVAAVTFEGSAANIDKERCKECGLCLSACPTGAIDHPYYRPQVMDAGLAALLSEAPETGKRIVAFACRGAMETLRTVRTQDIPHFGSVLPLETPSAAYADLYLVLRALDLGAAGVAVLSCEDACCSACPPDVLQSRFSAVQRVLDFLGIGSSRLAVLPVSSAERLASSLAIFSEYVLGLGAHVLQEHPAAAKTHPFEARRLLPEMARRAGIGGGLSVEHEGLPFGVPEFNTERCSLCGLCADACPTGALTYSENPDIAELRFDPRDCTGCRLCSAACPEDALQVIRRFGAAAVSGGPIKLKQSGLTCCRGCGQAYAPASLVQRVLSQLGDSAAMPIGAYCPDCRMLAPGQATDPV